MFIMVAEVHIGCVIHFLHLYWVVFIFIANPPSKVRFRMRVGIRLSGTGKLMRIVT